MRRLLEHYRLPESLVPPLRERDTGAQVVFKLEDNTICYGSTPSCVVVRSLEEKLRVVRDASSSSGQDLPYDLDPLIDNLLLERYSLSGRQRSALEPVLRPAYYTVRPLLPVAVRKHLQRLYFSGWQDILFPAWPVDCTVEYLQQRQLALLMKSHDLDVVPFIWFWPNGYDSCIIVTHDIENHHGKEFCSALMDIDDAFGISASFQVIPEDRYPVSPAFLAGIRQRGFEVNVHDLNHDGNLFSAERLFMERVGTINRYGREFHSAGFRSGAMYRNQRWYHALEFEYDMSVPNVAHLEAQQGGCCTVFPYFIGDLLELPLTTTQDYALFNILQGHSLDLWIEQIELIRQQHGLISILVHPDYIQHKSRQKLYRALLGHLYRLRQDQNILIAKPGEVNCWWRIRNQLRLVPDGSRWRIEGAGSERARIAYAYREGDRITYRFEDRPAVQVTG